jgi:valyl-tRNA synthetase
MPPPNITGRLHLGHALFLSIQDAQTRFRALTGDDALWLPGTDHAGLATHEKILAELAAAGGSPDDADAYWRTAWSRKGELQHAIGEQIRRIGASCDWSRERFTLDAGSQSSALAAFSRCCEQGLIRRENGEWLLRMDELASRLLAAIDDGEIRIEPQSSANELRSFLLGIEPWKIARDIPWGLRLPIETQGERWRLIASPELTRPPGEPALFGEAARTIHERALTAMGRSAADSAGEGPWTPEEKTFDTWFLSALWPFSSLGWPEKTDDFARFYPAAWMETGDDILFFWCARMLMMGWLLTGQWPFRDIYLHGLMRDAQGRKMSKSLGNGIDPLGLMDAHGADALRWSLLANLQPARDLRFDPGFLAREAKFINKIWQAGRFLAPFCAAPSLAEEAWRQSPFGREMADLAREWFAFFMANDLAQAARLIQRHFRDRFCGQWIEGAKEGLRAGDARLAGEGMRAFSLYMALLHPFLPFLTSELHETLGLAPPLLP